MSAIKLQSSDGVIFEVDPSILSQSKVIKTILEECDTEDPLPLPKIESECLKNVIHYCNYHSQNEVSNEITRPLTTNNFRNIGVSEWDCDFIMGMEHSMLFEMILAANYLDIHSLLDICSARLASLIKSKTTVQIRECFNITNDFTPEEEVQIREENRWCQSEML